MTYEVQAKYSDADTCEFTEQTTPTLPGTIIQKSFYQGGGTAGNGNGDTVTKSKQDNKNDTCKDFLLNGNDS